MSNDPFSLFLADSLITNELDSQNTKYLSTITTNSQITNLGQIGNPDGFYYYHPLVHSSVNQGITIFNSGIENLPFLFPIG
jgi:hypothetical protein